MFFECACIECCVDTMYILLYIEIFSSSEFFLFSSIEYYIIRNTNMHASGW